MIEKVLTGIGFVALCAMFFCMMMVAESDCIVSAILPFLGVIVTGAVAIYVSNSIEYDDDAE